MKNKCVGLDCEMCGNTKCPNEEKEKIINSIDVSECCFYNNGKCNNPNGMACNCVNNAVCYFKELKRLQEENEELHRHCQICENFIDGIPCKPLRDMDYDLQKVISQRDKYIQALEEIRSYCDEQNLKADYTACYIINKIDEVLNDRD